MHTCSLGPFLIVTVGNFGMTSRYSVIKCHYIYLFTRNQLFNHREVLSLTPVERKKIHICSRDNRKERRNLKYGGAPKPLSFSLLRPSCLIPNPSSVLLSFFHLPTPHPKPTHEWKAVQLEFELQRRWTEESQRGNPLSTVLRWKEKSASLSFRLSSHPIGQSLSFRKTDCKKKCCFTYF